MTICKICNPELVGNGYCGQHSTSGTAYIQQTNHPTDLQEQLLESFDKQFIQHPEGVEPIWEDPIGCVGPVVQFIRESFNQISAQTEVETLGRVMEVIENLKITGPIDDVRHVLKTDLLKEVKVTLLDHLRKEIYLEYGMDDPECEHGFIFSDCRNEYCIKRALNDLQERLTKEDKV